MCEWNEFEMKKKRVLYFRESVVSICFSFLQLIQNVFVFLNKSIKIFLISKGKKICVVEVFEIIQRQMSLLYFELKKKK